MIWMLEALACLCLAAMPERYDSSLFEWKTSPEWLLDVKRLWESDTVRPIRHSFRTKSEDASLATVFVNVASYQDARCGQACE